MAIITPIPFTMIENPVIVGYRRVAGSCGSLGTGGCYSPARYFQGPWRALQTQVFPGLAGKTTKTAILEPPLRP
jgi:hypothetical protein